MLVSKVGRRGQIVLPRRIRQWLKLGEGDRVVFIRRGDEVVLQPLTYTLRDLRGSIAVTGPQDFETIRQQVTKAHAQKVATGED